MARLEVNWLFDDPDYDIDAEAPPCTFPACPCLACRQADAEEAALAAFEGRPADEPARLVA